MFNSIKAIFRLILTTLLVLGSLRAADQTSTFSPVTIFDKDYRITLEEVTFGDATIPTLQSFAWAEWEGLWVLVSGRTNGLHDFTSDGIRNFPPRYQNSDIWVIDPENELSWSKSLSDASAGLSQSTVDSLSSTNTQFAQDGKTLFVVGGYVYDSTTQTFRTYNTLSALDLPQIIAWVKGEVENLSSNAILQIEGEASTDGSYEGGFFQVTGGGLLKMDGRYYLIFGQDFDGPYTPGRNGIYTSQVRAFDIEYDHASDTLGYSNPSVDPAPGDPQQFRRRDMNIVPMLTNHGGTTLPESFAVGFAGVFYAGSGVWTVPAEIGLDGIPVMKDPTTDPSAFKQAMNHYHSAKLGLFSAEEDSMTYIMYGGISANVYNTDIGELIYDGNYGFYPQISAITRDSQGNYTEQYIGEFPIVTDASDTALRFGANAEFIHNPDLPLFDNGLVDLDRLEDPTLLGYIYGGIAAEQANFGDTVASNVIFKATYEPIETEGSDVILTDVRTVFAGAEGWYATVMGSAYYGDLPWAYSNAYGWYYSDAGNTLDSAWYYFNAAPFACWVYTDILSATNDGYWAYASGGSEVDGWFYMDNSLNRNNPGTFTVYLASEDKYRVFVSP